MAEERDPTAKASPKGPANLPTMLQQVLELLTRVAIMMERMDRRLVSLQSDINGLSEGVSELEGALSELAHSIEYPGLTQE